MTTFANEPASSPANPAARAAASGLMPRSLPGRRAAAGRPSTLRVGGGLARRAGRQLLPGHLLERGPPEADRAGDPRRVADVQVVLGVEGVGVEGSLVALVAVRRVAVVLQLDGAVVAVEQHGHLGPELDLVAALDRRAVARPTAAGGARVAG